MTKCLNSYELNSIKQVRPECAKLNGINTKVKETDGSKSVTIFLFYLAALLKGLMTVEW